ncbi:hypothetical protein [Sphingobacterium sp. SGR-19]|uniref:hypothetical protein n=1 Tax=Sphingobacterium sp. SGR-19 TaxID=2710886 RepID=UPI0013EE1553|nr:hypothetical protein [Sphingobacterium sp. SGR-19]NGM65805.1 hypothetical protein [Sphingobacterium sp. SGR-19]
MKQTFILFIIVTLISCRSYRERSLHESGRSTLSEAGTIVRYGFQFTDKDSLDRTWYFATDSVLYFHPEYGLISNGGYIHFLESQIGLQQLQVEVDSVEEKQRAEIATQTQDHESRTRYSIPWWIWGLGGLSIIAAIIARRVYGRG